jgi:RND family efflux transporter MFP subunit
MFFRLIYQFTGNIPELSFHAHSAKFRTIGLSVINRMVLFSIVLLASCNNRPQSSQTEITTPVSITELKKGSISRLINTTGTAQPVYGVELNSLMSGVYRLHTNPGTGKAFKLGDKVSKGQLIISLEDKEYENSIAIDAKKLSLEIALQEQSKQKALYEKGGVTVSEMRNTEVRVTNARYDMENATLNLEKMSIKAPFDGVIVNLPHYTPNVKVEQGKPMVGIMDYSKMYMDINLPESSISYVQPGQSALITHYTFPDDTLKAVVSELSPAVSTETRTFKGKVLIQNDGLLLRPGMFVKADIVVDKASSAIIIPKDVILSNRRRKYVYVVEKSTAIVRDIRTGIEDENNVEVLGGLNESDNLIVKGFETLKENSKVKVQK